MIDPPRSPAASQPVPPATRLPFRLIPRWNHEPGPRLTPHWTRLTLDIHISQLRNILQLSDNGWRINSVYAHGYRIEALA